MTVAQFEDLCDAGKISANTETFVLEMNPTDRVTLEQAQPDIYRATQQELSSLGFDLRALTVST
jgi:hypothetical protein